MDAPGKGLRYNALNGKTMLHLAEMDDRFGAGVCVGDQFISKTAGEPSLLRGIPTCPAARFDATPGCTVAGIQLPIRTAIPKMRRFRETMLVGSFVNHGAASLPAILHSI